MLPRMVTPKVLVVEQTHTLDQTLDWTSYPRQIELWGRIKDDSYMLSENFKLWQWPREYRFAPDREDKKELAAAQALPKNFFLLGRWTYKLGDNLAKQAFNVPIHAITDMVAVRVNSNWGSAEYTCMHKLQLFGDEIMCENDSRGC